MKCTFDQRAIAAALACALAMTAACAQAADPPYQFERGFPAAGTAARAYDASDLRRAVEAYKFFYPTMATSPRQQFGAANADTPYAIATADLQIAGPTVVELPPGPFIGLVDDHNMRRVLDMGTIGPEKGQGG